MRRSVTLLVCLVVSAHAGFAQQREAAKEARRQAAAQFNEAHEGRWQIQWDEKAGTPSAVFDYSTSAYSGPPAQAARAFLRDQATMFSIADAEKDLRLAKTNTEAGLTQVTFQQVHQGFWLGISRQGDVGDGRVRGGGADAGGPKVVGR